MASFAVTHGALPEGIAVIPLQVHAHDRGSLTEVFRQTWHPFGPPVQWNVVHSRARVMRGMHIHVGYCEYYVPLSGRFFIGYRDTRPGSPTEGRVAVLETEGEMPCAIAARPGIAHGLLCLEPSSLLVGISSYHGETIELGCHWQDPELEIPWPVGDALVSETDAAWPSLRGALAGVPAYVPPEGWIADLSDVDGHALPEEEAARAMTTARFGGREVRRKVLEMAYRAGTGHIASALSVADIVAVLYSRVLRMEGPADPERDLFVLSKGHAAASLFAALHLKGWLSPEDLDSYCRGETYLGVHPEHPLPAVEFSTGSLGLGLSYAVGAALGLAWDGSSRRCYALISDAELDAGITWESVLFARQRRLENLVVILDANGQQAFGKKEQVNDVEPLDAKFEAFGWWTRVVDGHDEEELALTLRMAQREARGPAILIARTVAGKGVSFMEGRIEWHYRALDEPSYRLAVEEIGR